MIRTLYPFFARTHTVAKNFDGRGREVTMCALADETQNIVAVGIAIKNNEDTFSNNEKEKRHQAYKEAQQLAMDRAKNYVENVFVHEPKEALSVLLVPKVASQFSKDDVSAHWWHNFQKLTKVVRKKVYACPKDRLTQRNALAVDIRI